MIKGCFDALLELLPWHLESLEVTMKRHKIAGVSVEIRSKDFLNTREL